MFLLLLACAPALTPAPSGSRSAELASRAAEIATRANGISVHAGEMEGWFDELRSAKPEAHAEIVARIRARAVELRDEAAELRTDVGIIEDGAQAY